MFDSEGKPKPQYVFDFNRLGCRVSAVLASPWIGKGQVESRRLENAQGENVASSGEDFGSLAEAEFWDDLAGARLPEYSWFTPDIRNDGHYPYNTHTDTHPRTQLVPQISSWLEYCKGGYSPIGSS